MRKKGKSLVRKMLLDRYSNEELNFILKYEYKGKNAAQWYHLSKKSQQLNEFGEPKWMEYLQNFEDTVALAAIRLKAAEEIRNFGEEIKWNDEVETNSNYNTLIL